MLFVASGLYDIRRTRDIASLVVGTGRLGLLDVGKSTRMGKNVSKIGSAIVRSSTGRGTLYLLVVTGKLYDIARIRDISSLVVRAGKLNLLDVSKSTRSSTNNRKNAARCRLTGWSGSRAMYLLRVTSGLYDIRRTSTSVVI